MQYSDYQCLEFRFDSGVAFASINHPPINLLDEVLSLELDRLGRELETDESIRVVVLQSALPDFFIAHSGLGRVGAASKRVSHTVFRCRRQGDLRPAGGGGWACSWRWLHAKIATAHRAGTRLGGAPGLR